MRTNYNGNIISWTRACVLAVGLVACLLVGLFFSVVGILAVGPRRALGGLPGGVLQVAGAGGRRGRDRLRRHAARPGKIKETAPLYGCPLPDNFVSTQKEEETQKRWVRKKKI